MQLLQQLIAAELNARRSGRPRAAAPRVSAWEAAYCGTNQNAIKTASSRPLRSTASGDSSTFTPGTSADSKGARAIADKVFWNTLP